LTAKRVDPTGRAALFGAPVAAAPDRLTTGDQRHGRAALFSSGGRQAGTVVIECSSCRLRTRLSLLQLATRLASGSAWVPLRRYQHWMVCPGCGKRHWCRIGWSE